jgi:hypothetical protein
MPHRGSPTRLPSHGIGRASTSAWPCSCSGGGGLHHPSISLSGTTSDYDKTTSEMMGLSPQDRSGILGEARMHKHTHQTFKYRK